MNRPTVIKSFVLISVILLPTKVVSHMKSLPPDAIQSVPSNLVLQEAPRAAKAQKIPEVILNYLEASIASMQDVDNMLDSVPQEDIPEQVIQRKQNPDDNGVKSNEYDHNDKESIEKTGGAYLTQEEREHLQKHLEVPIDTSDMTDIELAFYNFKVHDADKNGQLDGLELIKFNIHNHHQHENDQENRPIFEDEDLIRSVELILKEEDLNKDGYISTAEFFRVVMRDIKDESKNEKIMLSIFK